DAFVAPAGDEELFAAGEAGSELFGGALRELFPARGRDDEGRGALGPAAGEHVVEGPAPHVRAHHHARAAPGRGVVNAPVPVRRPFPQVVHGDIQTPRCPGPANERDLQGGEELRKDRDDVDPAGAHSGLPSAASSPGGASMTTRPASRSTIGTIAFTSGTSVRCPAVSLMTSTSWAG